MMGTGPCLCIINSLMRELKATDVYVKSSLNNPPKHKFVTPISICITILAIYVCHPKEPILMCMLKVSHKSIV